MTDAEQYEAVARGNDELLRTLYPGKRFITVTVWVVEGDELLRVCSNSPENVQKLLNDAAYAVSIKSNESEVKLGLDS